MTLNEVVNITEGRFLQSHESESVVKSLVIDSRKPFVARGAVFFAINGGNHDGHEYVTELYDRGVRNFIVEKAVDLPSDVNVIEVKNSVKALQQIAKAHRQQYDIPVIAITGSNGKTIVKEWLYSCLSTKYRIVKSPHSFNSQIGVPISVWNMSGEHELAIFEAGISMAGEMNNLAEIIQPTIGIFTNLGTAHDEGFVSRTQKFEEKTKLFGTADKVIYSTNQRGVDFGEKGFGWGSTPDSVIKLLDTQTEKSHTKVRLQHSGDNFSLNIPFADHSSVENVMHCVAVMLHLKYNEEEIQETLKKLHGIGMRLELKRAVNGSYLVDDTYNNDLAGLKQAIEFLSLQNQKKRKVIILSDLLQSGLSNDVLYKEIAELISAAKIDLSIGIGEDITSLKNHLDSEVLLFDHTRQFLDNLPTIDLASSLILVKGARVFQFEKITRALEEKIHGTILEINLDALTNNLNFYRSKLMDETKLMVMVKAFAYGSGSFEVANLLQFHRVDYLGVAYADEGVQLRTSGIYLPIMVLNPSEESFESMLLHKLEPEMYNLTLLQSFIQFLDGQKASIHIKLETGMKRLGFEKQDLDELIELLKANKNIEVKSIFSHLAGADESRHNDFSKQQAALFNEGSEKIMRELGIKPLRHLVNSAGTLRFPEFHYDMVRLGIGLYGLETNAEEQDKLLNISTLKTVVSQVRKLEKGETVGYGRNGVAEKRMEIATIAIGYADGYTRAFSGGVGEVWVNGKRAKVIGNVCMDMTMIDVTGMNVKERDEVEIFGPHIPIQELADKTHTIPYEILTNVSQRVKRVYYTE
ncbi:MAG: bifunctional UDP-N-acetylmuramoyl-tripeptide:D-alanyl-D-alanine ligase/alanine racemase [Fulvivirga sp.]|uniref:bifunctional UDP-N-acetylmuramoyl-tripeptide:D-alanyl-D-alanine ligase/alanine racemase n=1 Tax=Fulvivirga sp. TaxID=1931237 RepID=UPI0032EF3956